MPLAPRVCLSQKKMNARKGIKTNGQASHGPSIHWSQKKMNARKGIKTMVEMATGTNGGAVRRR